MKILSLNAWGGQIFEPLIRFVAMQRESGADLFCFQEIFSTSADAREFAFSPSVLARANLYQELQAVLPGFAGHYSPSVVNAHGVAGVDYGLATFVRPGFDHTLRSDFIYGKELDETGVTQPEKGPHPRNMQSLNFADGVTVCNLHGVHARDGKGDIPERLEQSEAVNRVVAEIGGEAVILGDLNLSPDTQSLAILESGRRNLIKDFGIASTRSSYYKKENRFADYAIVSPGVKVVSFEVLPDEVSDHLPLLLEITF